MDIIQRTNALFADDDEDEPGNTIMDHLDRLATTIEGGCISMMEMTLWILNVPQSAMHSMHSVYCYLSTTSTIKMDEDLNSLMVHSYEFMTAKLMRTDSKDTEPVSELVTKQNEDESAEWID